MSPIARLIVFIAVASVMAASYAKFGLSLGTGLVSLLCCGVLGVLWLRTGRDSSALVADPAISTLVFPPDSRLHQ